MSSLGSNLLESSNFPVNKEKNLNILRDEVRRGNLGITIPSFEYIYNLTPKSQPFPIGCVKFNDKNDCFVFSWREDFSKLGIKEVDEYSIKFRLYPVDNYPLFSILIGINSGKVDPNTKEDIWYNKEIHLDLSLLLNRIKLYQLLNSSEILFCLFDGSSEALDSFGFSLDGNELKDLDSEVQAALSMIEVETYKNAPKQFSLASKTIDGYFNSQGLPKDKEALNVYLKRKEIEPKPNEHNWLEYISI